MTRVQALPPAPSPDDPLNFRPNGAAFAAALQPYGEEINAVADEVNALADGMTALAAAVSDDVTATLANALLAQNSADAATAAANAVKWVAGTNYGDGVYVWSPINYRHFIKKGAGVSNTDPANDPVNWQIDGPDFPRVAINSATTINEAARGKHIDITGGTFPISFDPAATFGSGWFVLLSNNGEGDVTLDPSGAETIDGRASFIMYPSEVRLVQCDGGTLRSTKLKNFYKTFDASANFIKPPGYTDFGSELIGAGAAGGQGAALPTGGAGKGGGGGGGYTLCKIPASKLSDSTPVIIGAGAFDADGGQSSFAGMVGRGGGRGVTTNRQGGNGGAGNSSISASADPGGLGGTPNGDSTADAPATASFYGGGGGGGGILSTSGLVYPGAGSAYGGGGGDGSPDNYVDPARWMGGASVFAGAGGRVGTQAPFKLTGSGATTTATVTHHTGRVNGDKLAMFVTTRHATDDTPATPAGWALEGTFNGGSGAYATGAGNARTTVFSRTVDGTEGANTAVTLATGTSMSIVLFLLKKDAAAASIDLALVGGTDAAPAASFSAVSTTGVNLAPGDLVLAVGGTNAASGTASAPSISAPGVTFDTVRPVVLISSAAAVGQVLYAWSALVDDASATATAAITAGVTLSMAPTATAPAGSIAMLRVRGVTTMAKQIDGAIPGGGGGAFGKGGRGQMSIWGL